MSGVVGKTNGSAETAISTPSRCSKKLLQGILLNVASYSAGGAESATRPSRMRGC